MENQKVEEFEKRTITNEWRGWKMANKIKIIIIQDIDKIQHGIKKSPQSKNKYVFLINERSFDGTIKRNNYDERREVDLENNGFKIIDMNMTIHQTSNHAAAPLHQTSMPSPKGRISKPGRRLDIRRNSSRAIAIHPGRESNVSLRSQVLRVTVKFVKIGDCHGDRPLGDTEIVILTIVKRLFGWMSLVYKIIECNLSFAGMCFDFLMEFFEFSLH